MEEGEVMLGGSNSDTSGSLREINESGYEEMESGVKFCRHVFSWPKWIKTM